MSLRWRCGRCRVRCWFWQRSCPDCAAAIALMAELGASRARRLRMVDGELVATDYTREDL